MSYLEESLTTVISRSYGGNKSILAKTAGIDRSVLSRIYSGQLTKPPTPDTLAKLVSPMAPDDRREVLIAAARDYLPTKFQQEIFQTDAASELIRNNLPQEIASVIRYLEHEALTDEDTRSLLRRIGNWVGLYDYSIPKESAVAEDITIYNAKDEE